MDPALPAQQHALASQRWIQSLCQLAQVSVCQVREGGKNILGNNNKKSLLCELVYECLCFVCYECLCLKKVLFYKCKIPLQISNADAAALMRCALHPELREIHRVLLKFTFVLFRTVLLLYQC